MLLAKSAALTGSSWAGLKPPPDRQGMAGRKISLPLEPNWIFGINLFLCGVQLQEEPVSKHHSDDDDDDDGETVKLRQRQSVIKSLSLPQAELRLGKCFGCGGL